MTTVGGAIDFSGAVTGDKGSATAVGNGSRKSKRDVTFGSTLTLSSGGNDDLTITAGTGAVTLTGAVGSNDNDLTVASSQNSVITAGISGSTGATGYHRQRNHRHQWRSGDERNRNNHPGCSKFGSGCDHSGWRAIDFSGAVTGDKGSATAVGTGAGGGDVTFWIDAYLEQWR